MDTRKKIYLAGGCFWGVEHFFKQVKGVTDTEVGYANSRTPNPTYREVCTGETHAAETVLVTYDPGIAPLPFLLRLFFEIIDPTLLNRQGNDVGTQYRTGIYYTDAADLAPIEAHLGRIRHKYTAPIVVEVAPLTSFYPAEASHQDYLQQQPHGYCHIHPKWFTFAKHSRPLPEDFE